MVVFRTCCCSRYSPTKASARWSRRADCMSEHGFNTTGDYCPLMPTYGPPSVMFVRGRGTELWDSEGKRYLDFLSGLAVTSLGHAHPAVAEALAEQARTLLHVSNLFGNVVGPEVAATLDRLVAGGDERAGGQVFFTNSGAEANECAIKLARKWAGPG